MREYKFRGRDEHGVWHYGYLANIRLQSFPRWDSPTVIRFAEIVDEDDLTNRVDPDTVGQYTGLRDSDGRGIYEGDIIKVRTQNPYWRFRRNFVVEWGTDGWLLDGDSLYSWFSLHTLEVIGNIHDNPGLLEQRP